MVRVVEKKILPEWFEKIVSGEKNVEVRLADFEVSVGDILVLKEWDPVKKQFTGRKISKVVKKVHKVDIAKYYEIEEIKKYGIYLIELK
ncbi:MAG: DUF3850 domain-containing protein [archaeon GB-1867-005]|nr:DUF3850 domain-containing protein [Candidatus Culexmicrobium cathedralense]